MARREDIEKLRQQAEESEDLATLEGVHKQFTEIVASLNANVAGTRDEDVLNLLTEMRDEAQCADEELKRKIAEIKVDMLDPLYEQRKAEREREKQANLQKEEMWKQKLATEGFGGVLKGLGEMFGGTSLASASAANPAIAAAPALKCTGCGDSLSASAKFCTGCGQPVVREKLCTGCGTKLQPQAKFCPECGTRNV